MREAMQEVSCGIYESPIGRLKIFCTQDGVKSVGFQREEAKAERMTESPSPKSEQMLDKTREELKEYFEGKRKTFSVPCVMEGTEFQKKVWKALAGNPIWGNPLLSGNCRTDRKSQGIQSRRHGKSQESDCDSRPLSQSCGK